MRRKFWQLACIKAGEEPQEHTTRYSLEEIQALRKELTPQVEPGGLELIIMEARVDHE